MLQSSPSMYLTMAKDPNMNAIQMFCSVHSRSPKENTLNTVFQPQLYTNVIIITSVNKTMFPLRTHIYKIHFIPDNFSFG